VQLVGHLDHAAAVDDEVRRVENPTLLQQVPRPTRPLDGQLVVRRPAHDLGLQSLDGVVVERMTHRVRRVHVERQTGQGRGIIHDLHRRMR
jgi:hypothetical protein